MSHNLHRRGPIDSLRYDFPILTRPANGRNDQGACAKLQRFTALAAAHGPVNMGVSRCGNLFTASPELIIQTMQDRRTVNVVFDDRDKFKAFLRELLESGWDLSVTTAGLMDAILEICKELGITPHSANVSLGVFGRVDLLPPEEILLFTTMCGHHQIAPSLVEHHRDLVKKGKSTPRQAAEALAKHCPCGIVNTTRAQKQLEAYLQES